MGLTGSELTTPQLIDPEFFPNGIVPEQFSGSMLRDTDHGAGDFVEETDVITTQLEIQPVRAITGHNLVDGWNFFAWTMPYEQDAVEALCAAIGESTSFANLESAGIILVKDNEGGAMLPEFNFNGINNFQPGKGYQIKIDDSISSKFIGQLTFKVDETKHPTVLSVAKALSNIKMTFTNGWNIIGYNRLKGNDRDIVDTFENMVRAVNYPSEINHESQLQGSIRISRTVPGNATLLLPGGLPDNLNFMTGSAQIEEIAPLKFRYVMGTGTTFLTDYTPGDSMQFDLDDQSFGASITKVQRRVLLVVNDELLAISDRTTLTPTGGTVTVVGTGDFPSPLPDAPSSTVDGTFTLNLLTAQIIGTNTKFLEVLANDPFPQFIVTRYYGPSFVFISSNFPINLDSSEIISDTEIDLSANNLQSLINLVNLGAIQGITETSTITVQQWNNHTETPSAYYKSTAIDDIVDIVPDIILIKDRNGAVFIPEFNFNGIGNFQPGDGYQLKMSSEVLDIQFPPGQLEGGLIDP